MAHDTIPAFFGRAAIWCLWAGSAAILLLIGILPHTGLYRTLTVLSGSMEPAFSPGDLVVVRQKPASKIEVGDIITYAIPVGDHHVESHRVVKIERRSPDLVVITKGDANKSADPWKAELQDTKIWTVSQQVPMVGRLIMWFRSPIVHKIAVFLTPVAMVLLGLFGIWRRETEREPHADLNVYR